MPLINFFDAACHRFLPYAERLARAGVIHQYRDATAAFMSRKISHRRLVRSWHVARNRQRPAPELGLMRQNKYTKQRHRFINHYQPVEANGAIFL